MENYAQYVKIKLLESIKSLESLKRMYVKHTDEDFSRTRKLTFDTMIKLILEMGGKALGYELRHYFSLALDAPTASAFIQRRNLISPDAFLIICLFVVQQKREDDSLFDKSSSLGAIPLLSLT